MNDYLISPEQLKALMESDNDFQLIDVRTSEKHNTFNIGGQLLPFDELPERLNELNKSKLVVTYCTSGGRSMMALEMLQNAGFSLVKSLDGGMTAWRKKFESE